MCNVAVSQSLFHFAGAADIATGILLISDRHAANEHIPILHHANSTYTVPEDLTG